MRGCSINGHEAFEAMFAGIESAQDYIIVQFYIIQDDNVGREFKSRLDAQSARGRARLCAVR